MKTQTHLASKLLCILMSMQFLTFQASNVWADKKDLLIDGSTKNAQIQLQENVMRPVYKEEIVPKTCQKEIVIGTQEVCRTENEEKCTTTYEKVCGPEEDEVCTPTSRQECRMVNDPICTPITRNECRRIEREVCTPTSRQECHTVNDPICTPITRNECHTENKRVCSPISRQVCETVNNPVCTSVTRNECHHENVCRDVADQVCRGAPPNQTCVPISRRVCENKSVCKDVPDRVCRDNPQQSCRTVTEQDCREFPQQVCKDVRDQVCRDNSKQVCETVRDQECRTIPNQVCEDVQDQVCRDNQRRVCETIEDEVCKTVMKNVCKNVPSQHCKNVPKKVCEKIPQKKMVDYDCSEKKQVLVGDELDYAALAKIHVKINSLQGEIKPEEVLTFELTPKDHQLKAHLKNLSHHFILWGEFSNMKQDIPHHTTQADYLITALSIKELLTPFETPLTDFEFDGTHLSCTAGKILFPEFYDYGISIARKRFLLGDKTLVQGTLTARQLNLPHSLEPQKSIDDGNEDFSENELLSTQAVQTEDKRLDIVVGKDQHNTSRLTLNLDQFPPLPEKIQKELHKKNYQVSAKITLNLKKLKDNRLLNPEDLPTEYEISGSAKVRRIEK